MSGSTYQLYLCLLVFSRRLSNYSPILSQIIWTPRKDELNPDIEMQQTEGKKLQRRVPTWGRFLHLLPLPLLLLPLEIYRGTSKVWLQHSRSLDHSDILLLTAMFTHPLLGIRPAYPQTLNSKANCNTERG